MKGYTPAMTFDKEGAASLRDWSSGDEEAAVAFLRAWAGKGPALELGIGTGRIALPLAATGLRVDGIDISPHVVEQMRTKPGGDAIHVTIGDFADVPVAGTYRLIYCPGNSFFNLLTQDDEVRCFGNVAAHLAEDGAFVMEHMAPDFLWRMEEQQYVQAEMIGVDRVRFDMLRHDPVKQILEENHVSLSADGIRFSPVVQRYAWPAEMDLMARMAGLRLRERWLGWSRQAWTGRWMSSRERIVSVWTR
ncbi:MAG: class I SAM-dependent methyltransferase [Chloroflexi bacterium]|nr:class I SAM-dependent methyltransferase [Chloroflexota bacterium]